MAVTGGVSGAVEHDEALESTELEENETIGDAAAERASADGDADVTIDDALQDVEGQTELVVRFGSAELPGSLSEAETVDAMQRNADRSQAEALRWAEATDGVDVKNTFWIANGILLDVDTDEVSVEEVARYTGAERVHANFELTTTAESGTEAGAASSGAAPSIDSDATEDETTYGLDMINATEVWDQHGTQGEGAGVAVLDTGVDDDHPDLEIEPDNWQQFDSDGNQIETEPNDGNGHGTHVSGTIVGPTDPDGDVPAYGVAPGAELYHGKVLEDNGGGTFAQIIAGMEWAVDDTDADVVSMSLGADGYDAELIEPSENARDAGVVLVTSAGNSGDGVSGTPGNVYPNFASGAVDEDGNVASFSSGEEITTATAYPEAPDYWPDEYTVPNAAAPGVDVLSAVPGGGYDDTYSGTSMSAPHHAGAFALMIAASGGDADREMLSDAMEETAWKPADWDEPDDEYDTRYGLGIIDVAAATNLVALDSGVTGTVTDVDGEPIEGATVTNVDTGFETTTDADGAYTLLAQPGTYDLEVGAFGYEGDSATVEVPDDETFVEQDFELAFGVGAELVADQPDGLEGGDSFDVTFDVANLESYAVESAGDYDGDLEFAFEGESIDEGEEVDVGDVTGEVTLTVATEADTSGDLELEHSFSGSGDAETITSGPTQVFEEFVPIAVVDDGTYGDDVVDRLEDQLIASYDVSLIDGADAVDAAANDEYEAYVVQNIDETYVEELAASTDGPDTGVVWLDNWGSSSDAIPAKADALGNPESTAESFASPNPDVELLEDHPIFDGVGDAGDALPIHSATYADHSWFDGYDGDVIGHIQAGGVTDGEGVGVDEQQRTVLLSTFGSSSFVDAESFSDDADAILANAVEWSAEQPPVDVAEEQPDRVDTGEMFGTTYALNDVEMVQVSLADESTVAQGDLDLYLDGGTNAWDEWRAYHPPVSPDDYAVEVDPAEDVVGSVVLETTFAFADHDDVTVTTGPTAVYDAPLTVGDDVETIQEAIDLAPDGAEIVVESGTYEEDVTIADTDDLTITGEDGATVVSNDTAVTIGADGTTLSGVAADGVAVEGASNVSVSDVDIANASSGVAVTDSANVDVTDVETSVVDTGVLVEDSETVDVANASISGGEYGIAVEGASDVTITNNTVENAATGLSIADGALESLSANDVSGAETGIAVIDGASVTDLSNNELTDSTVGLDVSGPTTTVDATDNTIDAAVGVNASDIATDAISFAYNDLESTDAAIVQDGDEAFDARLNWFGERGPAANAGVEGDVVTQPFLTETPDAVDPADLTEIAVDLEFEAGETYTIGVPGTTDQTVGDAFGDLEGTVYDYDADDGTWETLHSNDELSSLSALVVVPAEDGQAVFDFQYDGDTVVPGSEELVQGWNLVSPSSYAEYEDGFGSSNTPDNSLAAYDHGAGHLGEDVALLDNGYRYDPATDVNPFGGYWIHVESADDTYEYGVELHTNPTPDELYEELGLVEQDSPENLTAAASAPALG